jgi:hypothetical protein
MMPCAYNLSILETETGVLGVQGQPGLHPIKKKKEVEEKWTVIYVTSKIITKVLYFILGY